MLGVEWQPSALAARAIAQQIHEIGQPVQPILTLHPLAAILDLLILAEPIGRIVDQPIQRRSIRAFAQVAGAPQRQVLA